MRNTLLFCIGILLLVGCGNDDSSNPTPTNNSPVITAITATPNPVPKNRTAAFEVTATDADNDALTYAWSATAGTFATGNNTSQVTWVPPTTETGYTVSVTVSDGTASVDTSITVNVTGSVFNLSGQIRNQFNHSAGGVTMNVTDAHDGAHTAVTGSNGSFSFADLPEGQTIIALTTTEMAVHNLPRYLDRDTTVNLTENTVATGWIREFYAILHDSGIDTTLWNFIGSVDIDTLGMQYILNDDPQFGAGMYSRTPAEIPPEGDMNNLGYLILGGCGPLGTDSLVVWSQVVAQWSIWGRQEFTTTQAWHQGTSEDLANIPNDNIGFWLQYRQTTDVGADFISIREIWIYCY